MIWMRERERERDAEQGDASNYANTETEKNAFDVFTAASQTCWPLTTKMQILHSAFEWPYTTKPLLQKQSAVSTN